MSGQPQSSSFRRASHALAVLAGGLALALGCFLLLPVLRAISAPPKADLEVRRAGTTEEPPPPPPKQEEDEPDPPEPPPPPSVDSEAPPMDLADLELVLSGGGFGSGAGVFAGSMPLTMMRGGAGGDMSDMFDMSSLEEKPRAVFKARPEITREMKKRMPCTVLIAMTVTRLGRVVNPVVVRSDDPLFNDSALRAIRQWKFEAGKRRGKPDDFRVRQPITFK
jgi:protein TonB